MKKTTIERCWLLIPLLALILFLWRCPTRYFFGIACPGCGMTRALLAAVRLDFAEAFALHPLWWLIPAGVILLLAQRIRQRSVSSLGSAAVWAAVLMIAVYILRLILGDPVVMPDLSAGVVTGLISKLIG